jgi:PEP-CTERM motif
LEQAWGCSSYCVAGEHGFLLQNGVFTQIDFPGAVYTEAGDSNNRGQFVGLFGDAAGVTHGFLATPVPEPSTLLLVSLGVCRLLNAMRRKERVR